jgi:hypothetical protein
MIKSRIHYWGCSRFADFIRGSKKPYALEWKEWDKWNNQQEKERPFRFWLSDTFLNKLQDIVYFPYDFYNTIKIYIRNRWIDKTHYLKTGLKPGNYYEFDYRILHGLFNEFVDFVEIELAHLSLWDQKKKYEIKHGRCIEAAYDYFDWATNLKHYGKLTEQAKTAKKIKQLYEWWKIDRLKRINPYSDEALGDIDDIVDNKKFYDKAYQIEADQEDEDTKMLIQLIKIRKGLWT